MQKTSIFLTVMSLLMLSVLAAAWVTQPAQALPEYSAQTGEPCATCHLSPSGGGPRGTRGQAWVGSGKPGQVPDLIQSLEQLGIHIEVDESQFIATGDPIPAPDAPEAATAAGKSRELRHLLSNYDGN